MRNVDLRNLDVPVAVVALDLLANVTGGKVRPGKSCSNTPALCPTRPVRFGIGPLPPNETT